MYNGLKEKALLVVMFNTKSHNYNSIYNDVFFWPLYWPGGGLFTEWASWEGGGYGGHSQ